MDKFTYYRSKLEYDILTYLQTVTKNFLANKYLAM